MNKLLLFTLVFSIHCAAHAQEAFSTLEERMSGKEFKETGLSKLTDEELATLNEWVRSHSVATLENANARPVTAGGAGYASTAEDTRGFEHHKKSNDPNDKIINSNIVGTFTGWTGDSTVFTLANGMIWKQAESAAFRIAPIENAEITIKKGTFGGWRLSMVGRNKSVSVNRIQ